MLRLIEVQKRYSHLSREEFVEKVKCEWLVTEHQFHHIDSDAETTIFRAQDPSEIESLSSPFPFEMLHSPDILVYPMIQRIPHSNPKLITVGRAKTNDIVIPDRSVSKAHASFDFDSKTNRRILYDLDSTNGTYLRGERLIPRVGYPVKTGDRIVFGKVAYTYYVARSFYDVFLS